MKTEIDKLCDQIISGAMSVYVKGCDDVAMGNIAQLRGICQAAGRIKEISAKGENENA